MPLLFLREVGHREESASTHHDLTTSLIFMERFSVRFTDFVKNCAIVSLHEGQLRGCFKNIH